MQPNENKEVYFHVYCRHCKHKDDDPDESTSPCGECLTNTTNLYSHKPTNYEEEK